MRREHEKYRRYLFGELIPAEQDEFERILFADESIADELDEFENDLVDAFVRDEMPATERARFSQAYLNSSSRIARVELARGIASKTMPVGIKPAVETVGFFDQVRGFFSGFGMAATGAAAALLITAGAIWYLSIQPVDDLAVTVPVENIISPLPDIPTTGTNDEPQITPEKANGAKEANGSNARSNKNNSQAEPPRIFALTLFPSTRSSGSQTSSVPSGTGSVRLTIVHDNKEPFDRYRVVVKDGSGSVVATNTIRLTASSVERPVGVTIPSGKLEHGKYEVALGGVRNDGGTEEIGFYSFRVEK